MSGPFDHPVPDRVRRTVPVQKVNDGSFLSAPLSVVCTAVHWDGRRSVPCLGQGCPLCPRPKRFVIYLPLDRSGNGPMLVALARNSWEALSHAVPTWKDSQYEVKLVTRGRSQLVTECLCVNPYASAVPWSDDDVRSTLARMWGLPDPGDYGSRSLWASDSIRVIAANVAGTVQLAGEPQPDEGGW